jgi:hypothetical protein
MAEAILQEPVKTVAVARHMHRWRIDEPSGPVSDGVCKTCGATKQFRNWLPDMDFTTNTEYRMAA